MMKLLLIFGFLKITFALSALENLIYYGNDFIEGKNQDNTYFKTVLPAIDLSQIIT